MTTIEKKSLRAGRFVDTQHVDTLIRTYKQERWIHNSERMGREDSLSLFYSIEELEDFLAKAKEAGANTVTLHFGVYPENFTEKPTHAGKQTTVLVATDHQQTEAGVSHKNVYIDTNKGKQLLAYNVGTWPPGGVETDYDGLGITIVDKGNDGMVVI
ncbi:hypothetical protein A4H97_05620 [Niastella yeongjuensis]|uniref:Uncharacterized protein n=1 Tax=Niastella yeongjuensis TaxID=354355 RepID=A0A1V9EMA0_9BACT|nr:hypothetical protein [Niastella yeongjuensis]OQP46995.1 hypothetical protein A4H97_05620 [Niastella yeongjuensis]SEN64643.1 hypothetical protein SAMN05660816_01149 [Niastella yeongjuensis]